MQHQLNHVHMPTCNLAHRKVKNKMQNKFWYSAGVTGGFPTGGTDDSLTQTLPRAKREKESPLVDVRHVTLNTTPDCQITLKRIHVIRWQIGIR